MTSKRVMARIMSKKPFFVIASNIHEEALIMDCFYSTKYPYYIGQYEYGSYPIMYKDNYSHCVELGNGFMLSRLILLKLPNITDWFFKEVNNY